MTSVSVATMGERPALTLAALGLVSGILSATLGFMFEPEWLEPVANLFWLEPGMVPIGVFYGVALGLGIALCTGRQWAAPLVLITTMIAWSAAIHTAIAIVKLGDGTPDAPRNLVAGVAAGAIGACADAHRRDAGRSRAAPLAPGSGLPRPSARCAVRSIAWRRCTSFRRGRCTSSGSRRWRGASAWRYQALRPRSSPTATTSEPHRP